MKVDDLRIASVRNLPEVGIALLAAPLDARVVGKIETMLRSSTNRKIRTLILDLEGVRYINSVGMTYLVRLGDQLESAGGTLRLANAQPKVKLILEMMGLTQLLKLYPSVESALRKAVPAKVAISRPLRKAE